MNLLCSSCGRLHCYGVFCPGRIKKAEALEVKAPETGDKKPRGLKPPLYLIPFAPLAWMARIFQFGISPGKYSRGNWRQPVAGETPRQKAQEYYRAAIGHIWSEMERNERAIEADLAGKDVPDGGGLALDGGEGGSSGPHLAHALCSLAMAIQGLIDAGLAPADFGQPWVKQEVS